MKISQLIRFLMEDDNTYINLRHTLFGKTLRFIVFVDNNYQNVLPKVIINN
jgi:hypothetical protein